MAFNTTTDRALKLTIKLGDLVESQLTQMQLVRNRERALNEAKFQQSVADQGLSYESQIEYRKKQIEEEKQKFNLDNEYIGTLEKSVADLRKLNRFKKIREDYLRNYDELKSGRINLQQHADFLTSQLRDVTDEDAAKEIRDELSKVRADIATSEISTLNNRVMFAQKDGTVSVLEKTIDDVAKRKAFADLAGNQEESTAWDVSLATLRKQLNETRTENAIHDIDFQITRNGGTAVDKLNRLNNEIGKADGTSPITIKGTTYASARQYWESKRDAYINGIGDDRSFQDFFGDLEREVKDKVDVVSRINKFGFVPVSTIEAINNDYRNLSQRAEFATNLAKLQASQSAALSYGVGLSAKGLIQSAEEELQARSGVEALTALEQKFGLDLSSQKAELNRKVITRGSELPGIKESVTRLKEVGAEPPSTAPEIKPLDLLKTNVTNPPAQMQPEQPKPAAEVKPPAIVTPPAPTFKEYVIQRGDTLSGIAQKMLGDATRYRELATLNKIADPNKIFSGAKLKIPI